MYIQLLIRKIAKDMFYVGTVRGYTARELLLMCNYIDIKGAGGEPQSVYLNDKGDLCLEGTPDSEVLFRSREHILETVRNSDLRFSVNGDLIRVEIIELAVA